MRQLEMLDFNRDRGSVARLLFDAESSASTMHFDGSGRWGIRGVKSTETRSDHRPVDTIGP